MLNFVRFIFKRGFYCLAKEIMQFPMYWGKAKDNDFHYLAYHCIDVACVSRVILERNIRLANKLENLIGLNKAELIEIIFFFTAMHDIGKFSDSFQFLVPDLAERLGFIKKPKKILRHDTVGYFIWKNYLKDKFNQKINQNQQLEVGNCIFDETDCIDLLIKSVTGHHGKPPNSSEQISGSYSKTNLSDAEIYLDNLFDITKTSNEIFLYTKKIDLEKAKFFSWWLAGLTVLSDWIGSNTEYFKFNNNIIDLQKYCENSFLQSEKAVFETGILPARVVSQVDTKNIFIHENLSPTQELAKNINLFANSLIIIEDVTGSGKTEAALILALRLMILKLCSGVYFALPTMATANAMYNRISNIIHHFYEKDQRPSLTLIHSKSKVADLISKSMIEKSNYGDGTIKATTYNKNWFFDNNKKSLLADFGIGTIDQVLVSVLPVRHQSLRLLGLADKVLIVDEVHACDSYMLELLIDLIKAQAKIKSTVIILSATLPMVVRQKLINAYSDACNDKKIHCNNFNYPLLTLLQDNQLQELPIQTRLEVTRDIEMNFLYSLDDVIKIFSENISQNKCICWIRNTVSDAIQAYELLLETKLPYEIKLFHSRFALGDRLKIEDNIITKFGYDSTSELRSNQILIATQVVEQSLDIDFDVLITDLAPMDLIIQRSGRLCRHIRDCSGNISKISGRGRPKLHVFGPKPVENPEPNWYSNFFKSASFVYENYGQLWLTSNKLHEKSLIKMPDNAREFIEYVYSENNFSFVPEKFELNSIKCEGKVMAGKSQARSNSIKLANGYDDLLNDWYENNVSPSRLSNEPSVEVLLAKIVENNVLIPWYTDIDIIQLSIIRLKHKKIKDVITDLTDFNHKKNELINKYSLFEETLIIPLKYNTNKQIWFCQIVDFNDKILELVYDNIKGLIISDSIEEQLD